MEFIDLKSQQALIKDEIDQRISAVLEHGRYIMGPEVTELEQRLAKYVGVQHCISVSSGTDSLLIAMMALGIGPGDEVITVPYTWISTAEMISLLGAKPVFIDIDEHNWNMDAKQVEAVITNKTKAIMPVGIYGQTADMKNINKIAQRHKLPVIEDAAQSFGASHNGKKSCALSTIGSTSFFPSKPLGCYGDGGALFTDDDDLAVKMRQIRMHGQAKKHHHQLLGLNGRLDTIQAAILLTKLNIFDNEIIKRQQVAASYTNAITESPLIKNGLQLPVVLKGNASVWAQYTMLSPDREALKDKLNAAEIPSVSYYAVPLHLQPVFEYLGYKKGDFPIAEKVAKECISLPMNPYLSSYDIQKVVNCFSKV